MWKLALAFVAGASAGWFVRVAVEPGAAAVPDRAPPSRDPPVAPLGPSSSRRVPGGAHAESPNPQAAGAPAADRAARAAAGDLAARLADPNAETRRRAVRDAAESGALTVAQLVERSRSDPDAAVRLEALDAAVRRAAGDDGAMDLVAPEVIAWIRDADDEKRSRGLGHLAAIGARGAAVGRELLDEGGLDPQDYDSAVEVLIEARRFDRLADVAMTDASRRKLVANLWEAVKADATLAPRIADVLRAAGPPAESEAVFDFFVLAVHVNAPDIVRDAARSTTAPLTTRACALSFLLGIPDEAPAALPLAEAALTDPASSPALRRLYLDAIDTDLADAGASGVAILRRVAERDASPWLRRSAAEVLSRKGF